MTYEVSVEKGEVTLAGKQVPIEQRVTNLYRRETGPRKVVHHHTDVSPAMQDLLGSLQTKK